MARTPRSASPEGGVPAELLGEIATTGDGRDITRPWVGLLQEPRDPRLLRSIDWGVYNEIRRDDQVKTAFGQRIGAVVSREWDVIPGDDADPRSVEAAENLKANLQRLGWDRITAKMLWVPFYGYGVAEVVWEPHEGRIEFGAIKVRNARRFRYDKDFKLRLLTRAIATDSGFAVPEGFVIELLAAAKSGTADFEKLARYMDEAIVKLVLGQTMTTQDGSSKSQAEVHEGTKVEIVATDSDMLSDSFNNGPARWWTDLNYGADVAAPEVVRIVEQKEDSKSIAEADAVLDRIGYVRTEESFKDTYGDGYEKKAVNPPPPGEVPAKQAEGGRVSTPDNKRAPNVVPFRAVSFAALDPQPLYVHRKLKNAATLLAWAKKQGFKTVAAAEDLHVTVAYSRRPVDWFKMGGGYGPATGELVVPEGGPRKVGMLGDKGAVVLHFAAGELEWRHREMVEAGASWDYPQYRPHVTITYEAGDVDLDALEPYRGKLVFGPEIFEAIEAEWMPRATSFADALLGEGPGVRDDVDQLVDELIRESGFAPIDPIMTPIAAAIAASDTPDQLDEALRVSLDRSDPRPMIDTLAEQSFKLRTAAELEIDPDA